MAPINSCSDGIESYPHLAIVMDEPLLYPFFLLLQQGVMSRSLVGCSVAEFLRKEIGATTDTIGKIQTIILDGKPVDDLESAVIKDGSVLALSAAMPGLVGATLRRGGAYSSFRSAITYHETGDACVEGQGLVRIKLFNLLISELGPNLLRKGVILRTRGLRSFAAEQSQDFWQGCRRITIDGRPIDVRELLDAAWLSKKDQVFLSVSAGQDID
jgi:hypothetical protein